ncbi:sigma-54 interaction domain-containing protein [Alteromonas sp. ASW11-130]|uniref:sigma-54 interaction domain-containing protein n=1 Tax=Alteromonas sp. ASW11-130 TaxID=3015775 RepID=UPI0022428AD1|nr:sigma-54 dependent transcriptional regulator [Alteromonas sp. ASW11-130]MCW8091568.1 sigma-54 dependent transcriptional regulator [Alteromonas sp. ASW11-130]
MEQEQNAAIVSLATKSEVPFDKIVILSNKDEAKWDSFERFLKKRMAMISRPSEDIKIHLAQIQSPIDYQSISIETEKWITKLSEESDILSINLTSGTPAMTTLSVLHGKGKSNTRFVQSSPKNVIEEVEIPLDFGKEYVKSASKNIAHTATSLPKVQKAFSELTAKSQKMTEVIEKAKRISSSEVPALILGETGTGKELMANAIHKGSLRSNKPIRVVNCGALAENLVDSTLFGHKKGAFTGADKDYAGLFEQANGGTLFLDEVGELKPDIQVKLLRALQQGEVTRLGDTQTINVDVRVIAATHQDLTKLIEQGTFREDLFYRLAVGIINMPPLRDRLEDIPVIVEQLTEQINASGAKHPDYISKKVSENGIKFILSQSWLGNIRELWSTLNRAFLWTDAKLVGEKELSDAIINRRFGEQSNDVRLSFNDKVDIVQLTENYQKKHVEAALKASGNVKKHATQMLGLKDHQTLTNWMKRLGIHNEKEQ